MRKSSFYTLAAFLFSSLFLFTFSASGQTNALSVFEGAVDQVNCETIRFIHREANRTDVAENMECLSFESIMKSIPEDEANTTGKLAKDINKIKSRYKADKEIGPQLDAAISVAVKKIESRPRKQNIPEFRKKLELIKGEAIKNAAAMAANTSPGNQPANSGVENASAGPEDGTTAEDGNINLIPDGEADDAPSEGGTSWLGWLSLLISLLALSLAGYSFLKAGKSNLRTNTPGTGGLPNGNRERDDASVKNLEAKMHHELRRMQDEFDEKIAAITASTGYTEPESMPEREPVTDDGSGIPSLSDAMVETMDLPVDIADRQELEEPVEKHHETQAKAEEMKEPPLFSTEEKSIEPMEATLDEPFNDEDEREQFEITGEEIAAMPDPSSQPVAGSIAPDASPYKEQAEPLLALAGEEEEEGLPFYKYVSMPDPDGSFPDERLAESAGPEAVYEVEMYEDVPNKAFFSPLPYPDVVARVLADPQKYLEPCCTYTEDPAGKQHIIVVEEGTLRKQGDRWFVHNKAKIRFA